MASQWQYYNIATTWSFKSLDEIKGKKIRATGVYADYVKALGGVPTGVASAEQYGTEDRHN